MQYFPSRLDDARLARALEENRAALRSLPPVVGALMDETRRELDRLESLRAHVVPRRDGPGGQLQEEEKRADVTAPGDSSGFPGATPLLAAGMGRTSRGVK